MKKFLAMMLVVMMVAAMFVACGEKEPATNGGENGGAVAGETYDTGAFTVVIPDGWKAFAVKDSFGSDPNADRVDALQIIKGGKTEFDLLTKPYIQFNYYGENSSLMEPSKDWYDEAQDIEPMTLGGYTWKGFTAKSLDLPIAILWTEEVNDQQFQASIYLEAGTEKITLQDADVQAILTSVTANAAATATEAPEATAEAAQ